MEQKIKGTVLILAAMAALPSCIYDGYDEIPSIDDSIAVELSIRTNSVNSDVHSYEVGDDWENYIDIAGGDYRIYFFTSDRDDASATSDSERNTLIAEFVPTDLMSVEGKHHTQYTLFGIVDDDMANYGNFKVVVLANWGHYPTVTAGETTIDALVEGNNSTFLAQTCLSGIDADHLIPFFGIREYSGVTWRKGWMTVLTDNITLLRAVAKVEVVISEDSDIDCFDSVSIVRYNESGYCAPARVYLRGDYDHDYSWEDDFTDKPHLVGGRNRADLATSPFNRQANSAFDTWNIYLPEYDNDGGDYSYIRVTIDGVEHEIYFANYLGGTTSSTADYDILRNCLYRFYVTATMEEKEVRLTVRVHVDKWEACFDNDFTFDRKSGRKGGMLF